MTDTIDYEVASDQDTLPLQVHDGSADYQYRISRVQVLNWGNYRDLHDIPFTRDGLAIAGPSGRGKSTLVDALSSVLFPNPQQFNVAARDDGRKRSERTVYTYARGYSERRESSPGSRATTNTYVRPPEDGPFASGTAVTFTNGRGASVTVFRLMWVAPHVLDRDSLAANTVYGFVHDDFDLAAIAGLDAVRGSSPISKSSLQRLIDVERGDIVDGSQARVHAKMRSVLHMGVNEDSQRHAFTLLRRAQSSRDLEPIDEFFKTFVLTEPEALRIWDDTAQSFTNAARFYDEFESARRRAEILQELPQLAEEYRSAHAKGQAKAQLLDPSGEVSPIDIWHGRKLIDWAEERISEVRGRITEMTGRRAELQDELASVEREYENVSIRLEGVGGGLAEENLRLRLDAARKTLHDRERLAEELSAALAAFDLELPAGSAGLRKTVSALDELLARTEEDLEGLRAEQAEDTAKVWELRRAVEAAAKEVSGLQTRQSAIPDDAEARRTSIEKSLGLAPGTLVYAGELLRVREADRAWSKAVVSVVLPLARTLLVPREHLPAVREHVNATDMRGSLTFVEAESGAPVETAPAGSLAELLEFADHPFAGWVSGELVRTANYLRVDSAKELSTDPPKWAAGAITIEGLRSGARGRYTKDDRRQRYPWLGWDNRSLVGALESELESQKEALAQAEARAKQLDARIAAANRRVRALTDLPERLERADLESGGLDVAGARKVAEELSAQLAASADPAVDELKAQKKSLSARRDELTKHIGVLEDRVTNAETQWGALVDVQDAAHDAVDGAELPADLASMVEETEFRAPADASKRAVAASLGTARDSVRDQIALHLAETGTRKARIEAILQRYRQLGAAAARETDGTIESLDAMLEVYERLRRDDVPRAKAKWIRGASKDLMTGFSGLLMQIDSDERDIVQALEPINSVLRNISFRGDSILSIEVDRKPTRERREFRDIVKKYGSPDTLARPTTDEAEVEKNFLTLRKSLENLLGDDRDAHLWRARVFDARENMEFRAVQTRPNGDRIPLDGVAGMSGGEGQELIAFVLGAALRMRLGEGHDAPPTYAPIVLDEGFVKSDSDFTARALNAFKALGFQLVIAAPREKAAAFDRFVGSIVYVNHDRNRFENGSVVRRMTLADLEEITGEGGDAFEQ